MPKKVSHLDTDMMEQDNAKRTELADALSVIIRLKVCKLSFLMCIHHIYLIYGSLGSARVMKVDICEP